MLNYVDLIVGIIANIATVIALIFAVKQLSESVLTRRLEMVRDVISEVGSADIRETRHILLDMKKELVKTTSNNLLPSAYTLEIEKKENGKKENEKDGHLARVLQLAVAYDRVAFLLLYDKKSLPIFFDFQGKEVINLWPIVEGSIKKYAKETSNPNYCIHFKKLYLEMIKLDQS